MWCHTPFQSCSHMVTTEQISFADEDLLLQSLEKAYMWTFIKFALFIAFLFFLISKLKLI